MPSAAGMRLLSLAREAAACAASFCMRPPLDAAAVSRSWQTRVRPSLDAAAAYARPTQRAAWAVGSVTAVVAALCAHAAECSVYRRSCPFIALPCQVAPAEDQPVDVAEKFESLGSKRVQWPMRERKDIDRGKTDEVNTIAATTVTTAFRAVLRAVPVYVACADPGIGLLYLANPNRSDPACASRVVSRPDSYR
ncbi:hypothetical protein BHE74_00050298 [Ensete ventricosum]|nr:hypothetical protein BHE74_00050298 [Ensete ventricosum]RZS20173.1 hypothetical protein BHM03_00052658 [Ensete ventricosum]